MNPTGQYSSCLWQRSTLLSITIAFSHAMQPSSPSVFLGPTHPVQASWQLTQVWLLGYLEIGHSDTQYLPSRKWRHSKQSDASGPLHDPLHSGWHWPQFNLSTILYKFDWISQDRKQVPSKCICLHSRHWSDPAPQQPASVHSSERYRPSRSILIRKN